MKKKSASITFVVLIGLATLIYNGYIDKTSGVSPDSNVKYAESILNISPYDGVNKYVVINNNEPYFLEEDFVLRTYEFYSDLDSLGRAGVAMSLIGLDLMPTEERGEIGSIKPSGWHTVKYDFISGKYLYNRCHLIGYQLTGENANEKNLITCTRNANTGIMLDYENKVSKYIKETGNHVLYRVTPVYQGNNLLVSGIQMEAKSIEDNGSGIKFNIYIYNVQDGVKINYETGDSVLDEKRTS
ncbi:MAG: DNA/RNA non-specific endonuclease [Bacilli bacterium]|nr:DNA/RNA non-specific endonuclease [Bacilli bacterium]